MSTSCRRRAPRARKQTAGSEAPFVTVDIPELDDARIEALAVALLPLLDQISAAAPEGELRAITGGAA